MTIREAVKADAEVLYQIEAECFPAAEAATKKSIEERLDYYANHFFLMEEDGRVIGFINGLVTDTEVLEDEMYEHAEWHDENGAWQMIFGVDTIPEYRCRGYAGKLIEHMITIAGEQGRKGLVLTCKDHLVHYYAKFGFKDEGFCGSTHGGVIWHQMRLTL